MFRTNTVEKHWSSQNHEWWMIGLVNMLSSKIWLSSKKYTQLSRLFHLILFSLCRLSVPRRSASQESMAHVMVPPCVRWSRRLRSHSMENSHAASVARWVGFIILSGIANPNAHINCWPRHGGGTVPGLTKLLCPATRESTRDIAGPDMLHVPARLPELSTKKYLGPTWDVTSDITQFKRMILMELPAFRGGDCIGGRDIEFVPCYPGKYPGLCREITKVAGHFPAQVPATHGSQGPETTTTDICA